MPVQPATPVSSLPVFAGRRRPLDPRLQAAWQDMDARIQAERDRYKSEREPEYLARFDRYLQEFDQLQVEQARPLEVSDGRKSGLKNSLHLRVSLPDAPSAGASTAINLICKDKAGALGLGKPVVTFHFEYGISGSRMYESTPYTAVWTEAGPVFQPYEPGVLHRGRMALRKKLKPHSLKSLVYGGLPSTGQESPELDRLLQRLIVRSIDQTNGNSAFRQLLSQGYCD